MTAIKKDELVRLEAQYGLDPDDLSYQHRCSRITAYMKGEGESWKKPDKPERNVQGPKVNVDNERSSSGSQFKDHPLYGKRILITPMMTPDKDRNLAYDEILGPEIVVNDFNAGERIYGAAEDVQRMVGDYEIVHVDKTRSVVAKTTFPKIGTEISWKLGHELVPVVTGNDGKRGYIWSFPTSVIQVQDSLIQVYGLKTLIRHVYPELEPKFKNKPMMDYVDGITLVASIPQTHALLKQHRRNEMMAAQAGLDSGYDSII